VKIGLGAWGAPAPRPRLRRRDLQRRKEQKCNGKLCLSSTFSSLHNYWSFGVSSLFKPANLVGSRPNANMSFHSSAFRERSGARCPRWGLRLENSRPAKPRTDRAVTSYGPWCSLLLSDTRMKARERARVAQFVRIFQSLAILVYSLAFLLLKLYLLCLDARGLQGDSPVCHHSHLWSASAR
jgi:hypothetical protein